MSWRGENLEGLWEGKYDKNIFKFYFLIRKKYNKEFKIWGNVEIIL